MKNLEEKIYYLMRKSKNMRDVYRKHPELKDNELLQELECQLKLDNLISENPILKNPIEGFSNLFSLKPSEILDIVEYKSDIDIRMEFEKMKNDIGVVSGRKEFGTDDGAYFKSGISSDDGGSDFSVNKNDLSF